jgi:hypothetical protein
MSTTAVRILALALVGLASPAEASESSLRCEGGLVSPGDSKLDVLGKCGEPALRDSRTEERASAALDEHAQAVSGIRISAVVDDWTYNFGPQRFMYVVSLEGGKVVAIERAGYGYDPELVRAPRTSKPASCDSSSLRVGVIMLDLLARCGEPASKDVRQVQRLRPTGEASVELEIWTYDFGPRQFMHLVTLEDGKVVSVERGGYGYQR